LEEKHKGKTNMQNAVKLIKKKILFLESEFAQPIIDSNKNFVKEVITFVCNLTPIKKHFQIYVMFLNFLK